MSGPQPTKFIGTMPVESAQMLYQTSAFTPRFIGTEPTVFPSPRILPTFAKPGLLTQVLGTLGTKSIELEVSKRVNSALKAIAPRIFDP